MKHNLVLTHDANGKMLDSPVEIVAEQVNTAIQFFFPNSKWDDGMARMMIEVDYEGDLRVVVWEVPNSDEYKLSHILSLNDE